MNILRWDDVKKCFYFLHDNGSPHGAVKVEFVIHKYTVKEAFMHFINIFW